MLILTIIVDTSPLTPNPRNRLRRANNDPLHPIGEGLHQSLLAIGVEGALAEGIEVRGVDDVDVESVV